MNYFGYDIDLSKLPTHVGIIMDGNGRWAKKRGLERIKGHEKGYQTLKKIIEFNKKIGVPYITVYAFSTENWSRSENEVQFLLNLAKILVTTYLETLIKNDIKLYITGSEEKIPLDLLNLLKDAVLKTSHCKRYVLNIAFNYGGKKEIIDAVRKLINDHNQNKINIYEINENNFRNYLYHPDVPDLDLLIRTSGELRISNFLLWQSAYAELWFTKKYWPDFTPKDFCKAIYDYQKRIRRFGNA